MRLCTNFVNRPMNEEAMKAMLAASLEEKVWTSLSKIDEWDQATKGNWILSFSGGKDSTVLAYLCAKYLRSFIIQPHPLHLVFADTGLEYPEIRRFAMAFPDYLRKHFPGLEVDFQRVRPKERFDRVISKYGYPLIGKEVAEAIYAARKIRSQNVNVERERERESRTSGAPESGQSCTGSVHQAQIGKENPAITGNFTREMRGGGYAHIYKRSEESAYDPARPMVRRRTELRGGVHYRPSKRRSESEWRYSGNAGTTDESG